MSLRFTNATVGLSAGITGAVVLACATGAWIYSTHHSKALLDAARSSALADAELMRIALEHQMIENDRSLIARMVASFGARPGIQRVVILDRYGQRRYTSRPGEPASGLRMDSPACQACHQYPPGQRGFSRMIETPGGALLRTVVPILNRPQCFACHDPAHRINGILILDRDAAAMLGEMKSDLRWLTMITSALTLTMLLLIALVFRLFLLRRLRQLESAARLVASGDLHHRLPVEGSDTLAWLAREFNALADSLTGLVHEVNDQRERLETVINSIDDGILVLDGQRRIVAANAAFLSRAGQPRRAVIGSRCNEGAPDRCGLADCPSLACLTTGQRQVRICERISPEGATVFEEIHSSPVLDSDGHILQVVEVWRDITERRTAEARLAESHRMASLGLLASGFSHELNTPLATVLTCVEGIARELERAPASPVDVARLRQNAAVAREQILRCRGITQHFLRLSRGQPSPGAVVQLHTAVQTVVRLAEPTARAHAVSLVMGSVEAGCSVRADDADLQHALINILLNAIQACQPGGRVVISVAGGDAPRIRVSDNGCGIPPDAIQRIFEPFYGLRQGGTGLGLFLALDFVRRWGGDIAVESVPGQGSTFEIVLPALARTPVPAHSKSS